MLKAKRREMRLKDFLKKNVIDLFVMGKELHFTGSLVPAQACRKKLIRQKNK